MAVSTVSTTFREIEETAICLSGDAEAVRGGDRSLAGPKQRGMPALRCGAAALRKVNHLQMEKLVAIYRSDIKLEQIVT